MSSGSKSMGTLILAVILFLLVAGGSWFYFTKQQTANDEMSPTSAENAEMPEDEEVATETEEHDGHDHHGHDHGMDSSISVEDGTVYNPPADPILGERGLGDKNAPVTIREYFSLTCNHCASFHTTVYQQVKEKYIDTGKVYFIYEEFPLNGPALYGSMIARCLPEERYAGFIDILLRNQDDWVFGGDFKEALKQNAGLAGMSEEEFNACFENKELQGAIAANIKEGTDNWNISSTPSFVLNNGRKIIRGGKTIESFDAAIEWLLNNPEEPAQQQDASEEVEATE